MADVNKLLPDVGGIDTNITINNDMSLKKIANQYGGLGNDINRLGNAAAEDVHQRQVKLVGNDFGPVNPTMYGAYYQPSINSAESEMRIRGTEKALDVGMERGKAAAEANLNAAKNAYSSAMDGYNNAKEAFSQAKVAMVDSGLLPTGVTDQEFGTFTDMMDNPEKYRNSFMQKFTDTKNIDYNIQSIRDVATKYTKENVKNDKTGQDYWDDPEVSRVWTKAYYDEYAKHYFNEATQKQWQQQYDYTIKQIDGLLDYVANITDSLPKNEGIEWAEQFTVMQNKSLDPNKMLVGMGDRNTDDVWEDGEGTYETYAEVQMKDYINNAFNSLFGEGFNLNELMWIDKWRDEKPQEFNAYKNQVAMMNGFSNHIEVANGEEYYFINGTYEKPKKGTPIFFTYDGAMNKDGSYNNDKLKTFMELWKDYYKADVDGASDGEMADKQEALNEAYKDYMKTVSVRAAIIARSNMPDTGALSAAAVACVDGVANSKQKIGSKTVAEWIGEYRKITNESKDAATKILYDLTNRANANNGYVFVANTEKGGVTTTNLKYGDSETSSLSGQSKISWQGGNYAQDGWSQELNNEEAYALFTVLTQSMTDFNKGTSTDKNIDPGFLKQDAHNVLFNSFVNTAAGSIKGAEALGAFAASTVGAIFGSGENPWEADFMGIKGHSMKNTFGVMFDGFGSEMNELLTRRGAVKDHTKQNGAVGLQYNNPDSVLDRLETKFSREEQSRRLAQQLVNPLLTEVFLAETEEDKKKALAGIKGIGSEYSPETNGWMWARDAVFGFAGAAAEMYAEGALLKVAGGAIAKGTQATASGAKKIAAKIVPEAVSKSTEKYADIIASLNDPYQVSRGAKQIFNKSDDVANVVSDTARAADKAEAAKTLENAMNAAGDTTEALTTKAVSAGRGLSGKIQSIKDMMVTNGIDDMYGVLSKSAAHSMSSLSAGNVDDIIEGYNKFLTKARSSVEALNEVYKSSGGIKLPSGATVTMVDAVNASHANRVISTATIAMSSGRSIDAVARLGDAERNFLMKALNLMTSDKGAITKMIVGGTQANSNAKAFLKTMGPDNFKRLVDKVLELSEKNATFGKKFDVVDGYRALAEAGWKNGGLYVAGRDFVKEAIKNPFIDFYRNAVSPSLDENGDFRVQTLSEYLTDPMTWVQNAGFDVLTFTGKRIWNSVGGTVSRRQANKAWNAVAASGERSAAEAARLYKKAINWSNKAQEYADKAWHFGGSYDTIQKNVELSNRAVDEAVKQVFTANKWSTDYGGKHYDFKSKEDFYKFIDETKMNPQQGLTVIADSMLLKSANNYFLFKKAIGYGVREWGDTPTEVRKKILRTMDESAKKARETLANSKMNQEQKLHAAYQMMKADVLAANDAGEYGLKVRNFESSLDTFFNTLESRAIEGLRSGDLPGVEFGYIPISSLTYEGKYADMVDSHKNAATRGLLLQGSQNIDVTAANPGELREKLSLGMILDAMDRGDASLELHDNDGNVIRTVLLDKNGLDPTDMLTVYTNNYNIHKYVDPIFGDNRMKFGDAAVRNANAYIRGDYNAMTAAAKKDLYNLQAKMYGHTSKNGTHYKGLWEKVADRAFAAGEITKTEHERWINNIKKPVESDLSAEARTKATKIKEAVAQNEKGIEKQKKIVDNGGNADFIYQIMAKSLNITTSDGDLDLKTARDIIKVGNDNVAALIEAYSTGTLSEDNFEKGFRMEVEIKNEKTGKTTKGWRTIAVDDTLLDALRNAYTSGKTLDTVFTVATYVDTAPVYREITTKNGKKMTRQAYGYESKILAAFREKKESTSFDLKEHKGFNNFKFAEGTIVAIPMKYGGGTVEIGNKTVKQALYAMYKATKGSGGAQKGSQGLTEGVPGTFEASTAGHKEFSPLNAKFADGTKIMGIDISGKTIEDVYQSILKGSGKNMAPTKDSPIGKATAEAEKKAGKKLTRAEKEKVSQKFQNRLYDIWGEQNPKLKAQIEALPAGTRITDKFARTGVSQANALQRWVQPLDGVDTNTFSAPNSRKYAQVEDRHVPIFNELKKQNPQLVEELKTAGKGKLIQDGENDFYSQPKKWLMQELGQGNSLYGGNVKFAKMLNLADKDGNLPVNNHYYNYADIYGANYNLSRSETGDVITNTSENKFRKLQDLTEDVLYKSIGNGTEVTKRVVSGLLSRMKVEMSDSEGSFNGGDWFEKLDAIAPDGEILKTYLLNDIPNGKSKESLGGFLNSLEQDCSVELFAKRLNDLSVEIMSGKYDEIIPEGMDKKKFAQVFTNAYELLEWQKEYANKPKAAQEIVAKVNENGEEDVDVMDRYNNEYNSPEYTPEGFSEEGDIADSSYGARSSNIELDKEAIQKRLDSLRLVAKMYQTPESKFHKMVHSTELDALHQGRLDANTNAKKHYADIVADGKKLYKSGKSNDYNKAVDQAKADITARIEDGGGTVSEKHLDAAYAEALGLVSESGRINSIGINHKTSEQYNAAMLAKETGIVDKAASEGYNERVNNMRIEAGTYGGWYEQILNAYKTYAEFAGMLDKDGNIADKDLLKKYNSASEQYAALDSALKTKRSTAVDNVENSMVALFGDVKNLKDARSYQDPFELEQQRNYAKADLRKVINLALYGSESGATIINVNSVGKEVGTAVGNDERMYYRAKTAMEEMDAAAESNSPDFKAKAQAYYATVDYLYNKYVEAQGVDNPELVGSKVTFETELVNSFSEVDELQQEIAGYGKSIKNAKREYFTPSELAGKTPLIDKKFVAYQPGTYEPGKHPNDLDEIRVGDATYKLQPEYGTGSLLTDSGFGLVAYDDDNNVRTLDDIYSTFKTDEDKAKFVSEINRVFEDNGQGYRLIKQEDLMREREAGYEDMIENYKKSHNGEELTLEEAKALNKKTSEGIKQNLLGGKKLEDRLAELQETRKLVLEDVKQFRELGDLKENEDYQAARKNLGVIDDEIKDIEAKIKGFDSTEYEQDPRYGDTVQRIGDYIMVEYYEGVDANGNPIDRNPGESEPSSATNQMSDQEIRDRVISAYALATSERNPTEEVNVAKQKIEKFEKANEKLDDASDKLSKKINKEVIDREALAKKYLNKHEYNELVKARQDYKYVKEHMPSNESDFYHSKAGYAIVSGKEAVRPGYVTLNTLLNLYGYDAATFIKDIDNYKFTEEQIKADYKERRKMMKEVNKNLRKGNAVYNNVKDFKMPDTLDIKSTTMTLNNLLEFYRQVKAKSGNNKLSFDDVVISKDYADFLARVSREGIGGDKMRDKIGKFTLEVSDWNKFIQETQLAGGASWVNALSIAQIRGAIFSDPKAMGQYISLMSDFRDDAAVAKFAVENNERLVKIGMATGDTTVFTDLAAAASNRPGYNDGGQFSSAVDSILSSIENSKDAMKAEAKKYGYAKDTVMNSMDAFFSDATFKRVLPVLRAKMMIRNYDLASRMLVKHFPNISKAELDTTASQFAYVKTTAFFEPKKTQKGLFNSRGIQEVLENVATERQRALLANWVGAKDEPSIMQMAGNCFFALGYKNRMIQSILQGARSIISPTENIERAKNMFSKDMGTSGLNIYDNSLVRSLGTQFMQQGNRNQVRTLVFIAVAAFLNAKALGLSTPWDDLNFEDEENTDENGVPKFKVPEILTKFQTIGQIWIPNAIDQEGRLYIDPTKTAFNIDTMSSMFTLPNTAWKTIDRTFAPQGYYSAPQRGLPFLGVNNPVNQFLNTSPMRAIGDELIGSNLLSPYKAMYEVLVDSSYYGNNIWEKKYLKDGSINKNYDPLRNVKASFFHILGLDSLLSPRGYNDYVKGYYTDKYVAQDQIGSITGSGILQHEYATAIFKFIEGDYIEGIAEGGELPIKKATFTSKARTEFNTNVKNAIVQYLKEYRDIADNTTSVDAKDEAYSKLVKKAADSVAAWSSKYGYVLEKDQKLVPYVTKSMLALLAGEYDDNLDYIQNTYWKASAIAQIEATGPDGYWLDDKDVDIWIANGKTAEEFAAEKNKRHEAYNQALEDEYKARKALHDAGIDNEYLAGMNLKNLRAQQRLVNKEVYTGALGKLESKVGEFANFKEMKKYYEAQIDAATSTKTKANLAKQYNKYVTDVLAPYVEKYGASIITDGYYNNDYLSNTLSDYIIIPADEYYSGKSPRSNYLKDLFHVGYRDKTALPSDKEVVAGYTKASEEMHKGYAASASSVLDTLIDAIKKGRLYASDADYSKIVRMKALLNAKSK